MALVYVDVDPSDFSIEELFEVMSDLYNKLDMRNNKNLHTFKDKLRALSNDVFNETLTGFDIHSVADEMKLKHLVKVFEKYNLTDIEKALPV